MTVDQARDLVHNLAAPLWIRVWTDVAWHAVGRAADLQYLTHQDVVLDGEQVVLYFMFLKNATDGSLGAVKTLRLWRHRDLVEYLRSMSEADQVFPMTTGTINAELEKWLPQRRTTRDVRRGGASLLTGAGAAPDQIARQMAHQSERTQRAYTQAPNAALVRRDANLQALLSGGGDTQKHSNVDVNGRQAQEQAVTRTVTRTTSVTLHTPMVSDGRGASLASRIGCALVAQTNASQTRMMFSCRSPAGPPA